MAYPVLQLISEAYYGSNVVGRGFETVSGDKVQDGLNLLNQIINEKALDSVFIPYATYVHIDTIADQEIYYIPDLYELLTLTFNYGSVRFPLIRDNINNYFASGRVDNVQTLLSRYYFERALKGANLYFYPLPSTVFVLNIYGKFGYADVTINQDLSLTFDAFQILYLRYKLEERICQYYNYPFNEESQAQLLNLERRFNNLSAVNISVNKISLSTVQQPFNYAAALLYNGFIPFGG